MSGGKISPEINAASEQMLDMTRMEIALAITAIVKTLSAEIIPLQQDVANLIERVRNLEQGRDHSPTISDGQTEQKYTK